MCPRDPRQTNPRPLEEVDAVKWLEWDGSDWATSAAFSGLRGAGWQTTSGRSDSDRLSSGGEWEVLYFGPLF